MKMQPPQNHSRINLAELKAHLVKKLGPEGSRQYFYYLNKLLSLKLGKSEFDKLCLRIIGRENIGLHNQFISSILKNACCATVPPPRHDDIVLKSKALVANKGPTSDEYQKNESQPALLQASNLSDLYNEDILPVLPRKARTGMRERRGIVHCSTLGSSVKANSSLQQSTISKGEKVLVENGHTTRFDVQNVVHHHQGLGHIKDVLGHCSTQLENARAPDDSVSLHSIDHVETLARKNKKELSARGLLSAPLGIPLCHASVGGTHRGFPQASSNRWASSSDSDCLLDTATLRVHMEQIAAGHDLEGVSLHCANVLNNALDVYLKRLIWSCVELVGAKSGQESLDQNTHKNLASRELANCVRPGYNHQMQSSIRSMEAMQERRHPYLISLLDFRVAMELNRQLLGEDWPLLLEKISSRAFED